MTCPECKSQKLTRAGFTWQARKQVQRWQCGACGLKFTEPRKGGTP